MRSREEQEEELRAYLTGVAQRTGTTVSDDMLAYWISFLLEAAGKDPARELEEASRWYERIAKSGATFLADLEAAPSDDVFEDLYVGGRVRFIDQIRHINVISSELATQRAPSRRGPKVNGQAQSVALAAYWAFIFFAEKQPTTTLNPDQPEVLFVEVLAEVFRLLHIDASAEHRAKEAVKEMRPQTTAEEKELSQPD